MAVLVVGGAGYIGSHVAHALKRRGYEVIVYDNLGTGHARLAQSFELIVGDISDGARLGSVLRRVDAVMHFAAHAYVGESVTNPRKYFQNNVLGGLALLHAVLDSAVRKFIFSSSCAVYGTPAKVPIPEDLPRSPVNPYGVTKLIFEHALESYGPAYGLGYVNLRYFNAAGADEQGLAGEMHSPETHLIPSAFEAIQRKRPALEIYGDNYPTPDGTCVRDYIHVSDLAEAHVQALEYLSGGNSCALNLGTGRGHSVREVLSMIKQVTGHDVPGLQAPPRPGDPPQLVADPARAEKLLHWKATHSLEEIVSTAWKWAKAMQSPTEVKAEEVD